MSERRPQEENIRELPQTTTLPLKDLWRNYLRVGGIGIIIGWITMVIAFVTNWYYLMLAGFWDLCVRQLWLLPVILLVIGVFIWMNRRGRRGQKGGAKKRKDQQQASAKSSA